MTKDVEGLARIAVDCGYRLHRDIGPGLLESVYEAILMKMLQEEGLDVRRQVFLPIRFRDMKIDEGFRIDLLVEDQLLIELKSVERLANVHGKQLLTYLRLADRPLGLLMNFGAATFKEGIRRVANNHQPFAA